MAAATSGMEHGGISTFFSGFFFLVGCFRWNLNRKGWPSGGLDVQLANRLRATNFHIFRLRLCATNGEIIGLEYCRNSLLAPFNFARVYA